MNPRFIFILLCIQLSSGGVIPKDKIPDHTVLTTKKDESKVVSTASKSTTSTPVAKPEIKEESKHEDTIKKPPADNPKDEVDLQAGPMESEKKPRYGQLEMPSGGSKFHFLVVFILVVGFCIVGHTYRKKLIGYFIGLRRGRGRTHGGNIRYRRLSTGEAAIE